jgi:hypothetical protein
MPRPLPSQRLVLVTKDYAAMASQLLVRHFVDILLAGMARTIDFAKEAKERHCGENFGVYKAADLIRGALKRCLVEKVIQSTDCDAGHTVRNPSLMLVCDRWTGPSTRKYEVVNTSKLSSEGRVEAEKLGPRGPMPVLSSQASSPAASLWCYQDIKVQSARLACGERGLASK